LCTRGGKITITTRAIRANRCRICLRRHQTAGERVRDHQEALFAVRE
jgi:AhpD family alkylhydroperoxidase